MAVSVVQFRAVARFVQHVDSGQLPAAPNAGVKMMMARPRWTGPRHYERLLLESVGRVSAMIELQSIRIEGPKPPEMGALLP